MREREKKKRHGPCGSTCGNLTLWQGGVYLKREKKNCAFPSSSSYSSKNLWPHSLAVIGTLLTVVFGAGASKKQTTSWSNRQCAKGEEVPTYRLALSTVDHGGRGGIDRSLFDFLFVRHLVRRPSSSRVAALRLCLVCSTHLPCALCAD